MKIIKCLLIVMTLVSAVVAANTWTQSGMDGGGGIYYPAVSPLDHNLMFAQSDMSGVYRSEDGGISWKMINYHQLYAASSYPYWGQNYISSNSMVFHPTDVNTIYDAGGNATSYGLFKSSDKGLTWTRLADISSFGGNTITALSINRSNPSEMFAGTTSGAYCSANGGQNWSSISATTGQPCLGIVISQSGTQKVYIATSTGIYSSATRTNAGSYALMSGSPTSLRTFAGGDTGSKLVMYYIDTSSTASTNKIFVNVNEGGWNSAMNTGIDAVTLTKIAVPEQYPDTAYVTNQDGGIINCYKTTNAGGSWTNVASNWDNANHAGNMAWGWVDLDRWAMWGGPPTGNASGGLFVCDNAPNLVLAAATAVYLTTNGGTNWNSVYGTYADSGVRGKLKKWSSNGLGVTTCWRYVIDPSDSTKHYICYNDIGFARSADSGASWISGISGVASINNDWSNSFYNIAFDPDAPGTIFAAVAGQHDLDNPNQSVPGPFGDATKSGGIIKSTDYATSWADSGSGLITNNVNICATDVLYDPSDKSLYACMYGDGIYKSTDHGASWTRKSTGLFIGGNNHCFQLRLDSAGALYCLVCGRGNNPVDAGGVWKSTNKGDSWTEITANMAGPGARVYAPTCMDINPANPGIIYVSACGVSGPSFGQGGLYKTTNGGTSWSRVVTCNWGIRVNINPYNPSNVSFSGCLEPWTYTGGLFFSTDGTTFAIDTSFPFMSATNLTYSTSGQMFACTYGGSVQKSGSPVVIPPANSPSLNLLVYPNPAKIEKGSGKSAKIGNIPAGANLEVYSTSGELVRSLKAVDFGNSGVILWDGKNSSGADVSGGVYNCVLISGSGNSFKKLALLR